MSVTTHRGLTAREIVAQSQAIHPDWDVEMHVWYLINEEFLDPGYVRTVVRPQIESWLAISSQGPPLPPAPASLQLTRPSNPATEPQIAALRKLARQAGAEDMDLDTVDWSYVNRRDDVDALFKELRRRISAGWTPPAKPDTTLVKDLDLLALKDMPAFGVLRVAVTDPADGLLKFLKIKFPDQGKNRGCAIALQEVGGNPDIYLGMQRPGQFYRGKQSDVLAKVLEDPMAAVVAYGRHFETCGVCGTQLTDESSRKAGIGPKCQRRTSFDTSRDGSHL